jgi:hypothetical protein
VHLACRSREQRRRGNTWSGVEEDFLDTDTDATSEKDNRKEIADAHAGTKTDGITKSKSQKEDFANTDTESERFTAAQEEIVTNTNCLAVRI